MFDRSGLTAARKVAKKMTFLVSQYLSHSRLLSHKSRNKLPTNKWSFRHAPKSVDQQTFLLDWWIHRLNYNSCGSTKRLVGPQTLLQYPVDPQRGSYKYKRSHLSLCIYHGYHIMAPTANMVLMARPTHYIHHGFYY